MGLLFGVSTGLYRALLAYVSGSFDVYSRMNFFEHGTLQHTAAYCNTLQHTSTHGSTLQHTATHCSTLTILLLLQHTATHCNTIAIILLHCISKSLKTPEKSTNKNSIKK